LGELVELGVEFSEFLLVVGELVIFYYFGYKLLVFFIEFVQEEEVG
jgi:hypothetical protein